MKKILLFIVKFILWFLMWFGILFCPLIVLFNYKSFDEFWKSIEEDARNMRKKLK